MSTVPLASLPHAICRQMYRPGARNPAISRQMAAPTPGVAMRDHAEMHAIFVTVKVKPDQRDRFLEVIEDDATASVRDEPGCVDFQVLQDRADPDTYYFYEVYRDEEAFKAHGQTPHFARWRAASEEVLQEPPSRLALTRVLPRT